MKVATVHQQYPFFETEKLLVTPIRYTPALLAKANDLPSSTRMDDFLGSGSIQPGVLV
jgi:hypothetical protein